MIWPSFNPIDQLDRTILRDYSAAQQRLWPESTAALFDNPSGFALRDPCTLEERICLTAEANLDGVRELADWLGTPAPRIVLPWNASRALVDALAQAGCTYASNCVVLTRSIEDPLGPAPEVDFDVVPVEGADLEAMAIDTIPRGFQDGEDPGKQALRVSESYLALPNSQHVLAMRGGAPMGGAACIVRGELALLTGMSVLPEHRGKRVQGALLHHRLRYARSQGARWAVLTAAPGLRSQRNAQRAGFAVQYSRVSLTLRRGTA